MTERVALVTGGGSGIGREICVGLAAAGRNVAVADLNLDGALETASLISARGFFIKRREKPIFWATVICG